MGYYLGKRFDNKTWDTLPTDIFSTNSVTPDPNRNGIGVYKGVVYEQFILVGNSGIVSIDQNNINIGGGNASGGQSALIIENGQLVIEKLSDITRFKLNVEKNKYYLENTTTLKKVEDWNRVFWIAVNGVLYMKGYDWQYDKTNDCIEFIDNSVVWEKLEKQDIFIQYQREPKNIININPTITEEKL